MAKKRRKAEPRLEPVNDDEIDVLAWENIAPDTFAPDKPDQETRLIMSYKDTHQRKRPSKRPKGRRN